MHECMVCMHSHVSPLELNKSKPGIATVMFKLKALLVWNFALIPKFRTSSTYIKAISQMKRITTIPPQNDDSLGYSRRIWCCVFFFLWKFFKTW